MPEMTSKIYVDPLCNNGWKLYGKVQENSHLFSDGSLEQLHAFARSVGLLRKWFQNKSLPHYDITESMRKRAIALGAIQLSRKQAVKIWRSLRRRQTDEPARNDA